MSDNELAALANSLAGQRRHVLAALDGLDEAALSRSHVPSGWSPLALVQHLGLDDETFWVGHVIAGVPFDFESAANAWELAPGATSASVFAAYDEACKASDAILHDIDLDAAPAYWPEIFGEFRMHSNREVLLHLIAEVAGHAGQLDIVRESIDGKQWVVLT